jgi:homoserine/homoserine lactone efflux protein
VSFEVVAWFTLTTLAMEVSPGPAVLLVMSQGLRHGWRGGASGALGIETVNAFYFLLSALGLSAVLAASEVLFLAVKWAGAAYLVCLGARLLWRPGRGNAAASPPADRRALYLQGVLTHLANPKAVIFFTALLPQFIDPRGDVPLQFAVFGLVTILTEFPVLLLYGWLAERGRRLAAGATALRWFDRAAGTLLIGAGLRLAAHARA